MTPKHNKHASLVVHACTRTLSPDHPSTPHSPLGCAFHSCTPCDCCRLSLDDNGWLLVLTSVSCVYMHFMYTKAHDNHIYTSMCLIIRNALCTQSMRILVRTSNGPKSSFTRRSFTLDCKAFVSFVMRRDFYNEL